jgi:hypothetical protein
MIMFSLIYISAAAAPLSPRELRQLLETCNDNNRNKNITGMLLYKDGNFMQLLEGSESAVSQLHASICKDSRHRGVITLHEGLVAERQFPEWSMGFANLGADLDKPEGYTEFMTAPLTAHEFAAHPTKAQELLFLFKKGHIGARERVGRRH